VPFVPSVVIGAVGYLFARLRGRSRSRSLLVGGAALAVGLVVATVKHALSGH